jgi:hypothetical protein
MNYIETTKWLPLPASYNRSKNPTVSYCSVDRGFYIRSFGNNIHFQIARPTAQDVNEALKSDDWTEVFKRIGLGKTVRISTRIFHMMHDGNFNNNYSFWRNPDNGQHFAELKHKA